MAEERCEASWDEETLLFPPRGCNCLDRSRQNPGHTLTVENVNTRYHRITEVEGP